MLKKTAAMCLAVLAGTGCGKNHEAQSATAEVQYKSGAGVEALTQAERDYVDTVAVQVKNDETKSVVAQIGDWKLTMDELDRKAGRAHLKRLRQVYEARFSALDSLLAAKLYELEAQKQGITGRELFEKVVKSVDPSVDPAAINDLPEEDRPGEVESSIRQKLFAAHRQYVATLALKYNLKMLMAEPTSLVASGDLDGPGDGEIVLGKTQQAAFDVEIYSDFTCQYCREVAPSVAKLIDTYGNRVRFIYRPMISSERMAPSRSSAVASFCVYRDIPARYLEFAQRLFDQQDSIMEGEAAVERVAASIGISDRQFKECLSDESLRYALMQGTDMAIDRGIQTTPTLVIDGVPVVGNHDYASYSSVMEQVFTARRGSSTASAAQ